MSENHNPKSLENGRVVCTCGDYNCASLTQIPNIELNEEAFERTYHPIDSPEKTQTWEYEQVRAANIPTNRVWSLVDGDEGGAYAIPGYHVVNVFGYCVTEVPWEHELITGEWYPPEMDEDLDRPIFSVNGETTLRSIIDTPECGE